MTKPETAEKHVTSPQWWKHLRRIWKKVAWKRSRARGKKEERA